MDFTSWTDFYTDSREAGKGRCFIAIRGERLDGHDFLDDALKNGAGALLVCENSGKVPDNCPVPVFQVEDTVAAYQAAAAKKRNSFPDLKVIGVTGSVGKTSVKEMLRAILCEKAAEDEVLFTIGNTNNHIGVPQNLMRLNCKTRYAVIEMGTNHPGEIEPLAKCASPDIAIVNSIAPCHLEHLGSLDGVAAEKGTVYHGLRAGGIAVMPAEVHGRSILEECAAGHRTVRFGEAIKAVYLSGDLNSSRIRLQFQSEHIDFEWGLCGEHQAANASAAATAAWLLGISEDQIAAGLSKTRLPGFRMKKTVLDGVSYYNDAYNANPDSMKGAVAALAKQNFGSRLTLLLGDMFELGEASERFHLEVLRLAAATLKQSRIIAVGEQMSQAARKIGVEYAPTAERAGEAFLKDLAPGSVVFVKGSRGMKMENALPEEAR